MPLHFAQPKDLNPDPKVRKVVCTRITVHPATGTIEYEFQAFDAGDKPVGNLHTSEALTGQARHILLRAAYLTVQARLGTGDVDEEG